MKVSLKRCTFRGYAPILRLVTLLAISIDFVKSTNRDSDNTFFHMRPRLGYFHKIDAYLKIYEQYFSNVVQKLDKSMQNVDINDWRNVRPTGEMCVNYLLGFQVKSYKLSKPYELILLDSCLDWLYDESSEKQFDLEKFNSATKEEFKMLSEDKKLKEIFESTSYKDNKIPKELTEKIMDYIMKLFKIYADNPRNGCHSLWLESYNDFIEDVYLNNCEEDKTCIHFSYENSENDSYLNLIYEATRQASKNCYNVLQRQMAGLMDEAYKQEASFYKKFKASTNKIAKQTDSMKLSREMIRILQLVTGSEPEKPIRLADVSKDLLALKDNDENEIEKFTNAISKYAMQKVNINDSSDDPEGRARFGKAMTKLCKPYIDPKFFLAQTGGSSLWQDEEEEDSSKKSFEFYHLIYSLVRLTNHESIYGITKDKFEEDVLKNNWASLYLVTLACQMISTTWGQLDYETNRGEYKVYLRPNAQVLIEDWPIEVIDTKLQSEMSPEPEIEPPEVITNEQESMQESQGKLKKVKPPVSTPTVFSPTIKPRMKNSDSSKENQQNQKSRPDSPLLRIGLKLKNPLKFPKVADNDREIEHAKVVESNLPNEAPVPMSDKSNQLAPETLEMFRKLHGRYPKNNPGEKYPERNFEDIFPKEFEDVPKTPTTFASSPKREKKTTADTLIPLAFDFDKKFVGFQSKISGPSRGRKVVSTDNKWASLDAISL